MIGESTYGPSICQTMTRTLLVSEQQIIHHGSPFPCHVYFPQTWQGKPTEGYSMGHCSFYYSPHRDKPDTIAKADLAQLSATK